LNFIFIFIFCTFRNGLTIFSNDADARVTEAAVGRTKNYYIYLFEHQLLPKTGLPPAEVGPDESKLNWYEQEDQRWVQKMREQDVGGDVVEEGSSDSDSSNSSRKKKKPRLGKWLVSDVVPRSNKPVNYANTVEWGYQVAAANNLLVGESSLSGLEKGSGRGLFARNSFAVGQVICGSIGTYMLNEHQRKSKSDRVVRLRKKVQVEGQEVDLNFNIVNYCPSGIINDGAYGCEDESWVNAEFQENTKRSLLSTHYLTVVATKPIAVGDEILLSYGDSFWFGRGGAKGTEVAIREMADSVEGGDSDSGEQGLGTEQGKKSTKSRGRKRKKPAKSTKAKNSNSQQKKKSHSDPSDGSAVELSSSNSDTDDDIPLAVVKKLRTFRASGSPSGSSSSSSITSSNRSSSSSTSSSSSISAGTMCLYGGECTYLCPEDAVPDAELLPCRGGRNCGYVHHQGCGRPADMGDSR